MEPHRLRLRLHRLRVIMGTRGLIAWYDRYFSHCISLDIDDGLGISDYCFFFRAIIESRRRGWRRFEHK
jgi:hypothetical protein